ncbi:MAG: CU044_2847 family protein [Trebonia sp.]
MADIVEYPLEGGGMLLVQPATVDAGQDELGLASSVPERAKKANETLESALDQVTPALKSVARKLRDLSPDDLTVEFGLTLTAETGVIVAKGGMEVHFTVTLAWSKEGDSASTNGVIATEARDRDDRDQARLGGPLAVLVVFLIHGSSRAGSGCGADDGRGGSRKVYRTDLGSGR